MAEPKAAEKTASPAKAKAPAAASVSTPPEAPVATPAPEPARTEVATTPSVETPVVAEAKTETKAAPVKAAPPVKKSVPAKAAAPVLKKKTVPAKTPAPVVKKAAPAPKTVAPKKIVQPVRAGVTETKQGATTMATKTEMPFIGTDQFKTAFEDVNERAKSAMEKSAKMAEEFADLARGNVEALVASSKVAAKGVETLSQEAADYGRKSFEEASAALKSFAEVKSATDFFKLQSDYARSAFDAAVAESAKVSEAFLKIAGDVAEPITSRYSVAAERVKSLAA